MVQNQLVSLDHIILNSPPTEVRQAPSEIMDF